MTGVYRLWCIILYHLAKCLTTKQKGNLFVQPAVDLQGHAIDTDKQLECWAEFLQNKFAAQLDDLIVVELHCQTGEL